jgi:hypothetical protein
VAPFLALALLAAPAYGSTVLVDRPVEVTLDKEVGPGPTAGFTPLTFHLSNRSMRPQDATVTFRAQGLELTRTAHLEVGEQRALTLPVPWSSNGGTVFATIEGRRSSSEGVFWERARGSAVLALGATHSVLEYLPDSWEAPTRGSTGSGAGPEVRILSAEALPDTLAGLLGFRAVLALEPRWEELPEAERRVLEAYVASGGTLVTQGSPSALHASLPGWDQDEGSTRARYGFGHLLVCEGPARCKTALQDLGNLSSRPLVPGGGQQPNAFDEERFNTNEPGDVLLDVARAPVGSFLLIVLLFAGTLGFGSFALRRRYGPPVLVAFIPLTALTTCGGIATYGTLHEGLFTIHTASQAYTVLDSERHRAATVALAAYYAGLAPSVVSYPDGIAPFLLPWERSSLQRLRGDWSDGLKLTDGFIGSRSYQEHFVAGVMPSRARLAVRREGQLLRAENALGAPIEHGLIRVDGTLYELGAVADGQAGPALQPVGSEAKEEAQSLTAGWLHPSFRSRFNDEPLREVMQTHLAEGEFVVALQGAPFLPEGGLKTVHHEDFQLVRGRVSP